MTGDDVVARFDSHAMELATAFRRTPILAPFFEQSTEPVTLGAAYGAYLKVTESYVRWTVPMLRAASAALRAGDEEDRRWSGIFNVDAVEETDEELGTGHEVWAADDLRAVGAPDDFIAAPPPELGSRYATFMVDEAALHPYGALGAKGVLEHLSITIADDFAAGLLRSGIDNIANGMRFVASHGVLDIDHVRQGDAAIRSMTSGAKLAQILDGAEVTQESFLGFLGVMGDVYAKWAPRWGR